MLHGMHKMLSNLPVATSFVIVQLALILTFLFALQTTYIRPRRRTTRQASHIFLIADLTFITPTVPDGPQSKPSQPACSRWGLGRGPGGL